MHEHMTREMREVDRRLRKKANEGFTDWSNTAEKVIYFNRNLDTASLLNSVIEIPLSDPHAEQAKR